jgi:hypothetical protein
MARSETENPKLLELLTQATTSVPIAGSVFYNLGRNASYEAARRGDIPTLRIGRKLIVPVAPMAKRLGLQVPANLPGQGKNDPSGND